MIKKTISIALTFLMSASIAGCSSSEPSSADGEKVYSGDVEIEFYQQNESDVEIFDKIIQDFGEEYPNIKVTQINLPEEESGTVLGNRIQNNDSPDIYNEWFSQDFFDKVDYGCVRDMSQSDILDLLDPEILEQLRYNGKIYLIPMTKNYMAVYYNTDIFHEHGLETPTTLDELWAVCDKLVAEGITPFSAGYKDGWNLAHWAQEVIGNEMPSYSQDFKAVFEGKITGSQIVGIEDVADIVMKVASYSQKDALGTDTEGSVANFTSGKTAMTINGSWIVPRVESAASGDFHYAMFPFPSKSYDTLMVQSNADYSFALSAQSNEKKQEAAETFLRYMLTTGIDYYIEQTAAPSCVLGVNPDTSKYNMINDILEDGRVFRMPYSGRWTDETYLSYTVALQNLVANGNKDAFYKEFEEALTTSGMPRTYID